MKYRTTFSLFIGGIVVAIRPTIAGGGLENCASNGGPTICVRFDNLPDAPVEGVHYLFD